MCVRKEKTTPFGVNLTRSQVLYQAAQVARVYLNLYASAELPLSCPTRADRVLGFLSGNKAAIHLPRRLHEAPPSHATRGTNREINGAALRTVKGLDRSDTPDDYNAVMSAGDIIAK